MDVVLTIDTEVYPRNENWRTEGLRGDIDRDIYGIVGGQEYGVRYQSQVLAHHGLKGTFMVEGLFASAPEVGPEPLRELVRLIQDGGHEVQLHMHPEWVPYIPGIGVPDRGYLTTSYSLAEQTELLGLALRNVRAAGARDVIAFRAGDYAANADTLRALESLGIRFDTSYNIDYVHRTCAVPHDGRLGGMYRIGGIWEVPIAAFEDYPGHYRPAQLSACSEAELTHALTRAAGLGCEKFVIVFHSFEMLANRWHPTRQPTVRKRVVDRFEGLCSFLATNRDTFRVVGFSDVSPSAESTSYHIKGNLWNTLLRNAQQAIDRVQA